MHGRYTPYTKSVSHEINMCPAHSLCTEQRLEHGRGCSTIDQLDKENRSFVRLEMEKLPDVLLGMSQEDVLRVSTGVEDLLEKDKAVSNMTWLMSLLSALLVGLSGVFPIFYGKLIYSKHIGLVLSFAMGCLLGDVFFHLLPEVWSARSTWSSMWVLTGIVVFFLIEKVVKLTDSQLERDTSSEKRNISSVSAYLNLFANSTDNFAHGLSIAASYLIGPSVGIVTTAAILCHEIPHEVGDFAVLLNSGFNMWSAAKAQFLTSFGGMAGVIFGLITHQCTDSVAWMLAFTAGGFLYLSLVSILPSITSSSSSLSLFPFLVQVAGVLSMAIVTVLEHSVCQTSMS